MARVKTTSSPSAAKRRRPATTPEAREQQLISLAIDLVEQRLIDGTASSQETTHFLKLASSESRLKRELLELDKQLTVAKTEQLQSQKRMEELYSDAIAAMKEYTGNDDGEDY